VTGLQGTTNPVFFLGVALAVAAASGRAEGATYCVNNPPHAGGSDENPGTSEEMPWLDFTPVNGRRLKPGDRTLLARGAMWPLSSISGDPAFISAGP
jgi:hypothetical protein